MANPQKENGYTAIANEVLEEMIKYRFPKNSSSAPYNICFLVIRKTWGYQKKEDIISLSQFVKLTGYPRPTIVHWLEYLVKAKLLLKKEETKNGYIYGFNKNYEEWIPLVKAKQLVKARTYTSNMALTKSSNVALTHKRKKEITKEIGNTGNAIALQGNQFGILLKEFEILNPVANFYGNTTERKALDDMASKIGYDKLLATIRALPNIVNQPFAPKITKPTDLKRDFGKLLLFVKQKGNKTEKYQAKSININ
jgi:phage replication O-like protein O